MSTTSIEIYNPVVHLITDSVMLFSENTFDDDDDDRGGYKFIVNPVDTVVPFPGRCSTRPCWKTHGFGVKRAEIT